MPHIEHLENPDKPKKETGKNFPNPSFRRVIAAADRLSRLEVGVLSCAFATTSGFSFASSCPPNPGSSPGAPSSAAPPHQDALPSLVFLPEEGHSPSSSITRPGPGRGSGGFPRTWPARDQPCPACSSQPGRARVWGWLGGFSWAHSDWRHYLCEVTGAPSSHTCCYPSGGGHTCSSCVHRAKT